MPPSNFLTPAQQILVGCSPGLASTYDLLNQATGHFPGFATTTPVARPFTRNNIFWNSFQYTSHHYKSLSSCCFTFPVSALSGKTSVPTKVLANNKLVTTYQADPKDAPTQCQTSIQAMSSHKLFNVLCDNDLFAGFYVVLPTKC
jgi:hypothetical protein